MKFLGLSGHLVTPRKSIMNLVIHLYWNCVVKLLETMPNVALLRPKSTFDLNWFALSVNFSWQCINLVSSARTTRHLTKISFLSASHSFHPQIAYCIRSFILRWGLIVFLGAALRRIVVSTSWANVISFDRVWADILWNINIKGYVVHKQVSWNGKLCDKLYTLQVLFSFLNCLLGLLLGPVDRQLLH